MQKFILMLKTHHHKYLLTAGESNASGRMPVTLLMERIIETATEHANALGIGYATLIEGGIGWVLSRVSFEMKRYPAINEEYSLTTWIEGYNRRFSERNFEMHGGDGSVIGYARTIWVAMDFKTRTVADLSRYEKDLFPVVKRDCPIAPAPRLALLGDDCEHKEYTFRYCDIDFNRHVNTVRYLVMILNQWSMEHYDRNIVGRLDMMFHHECHYGETVSLRIGTTEGGDVCEIVRDGIRAVTARIRWTPVAED